MIKTKKERTSCRERERGEGQKKMCSECILRNEKEKWCEWWTDVSRCASWKTT